MDTFSLIKKHRRLFKVQFPDIEILFKLPTWKEYKQYISILENDFIPKAELYDLIFEEVVLSKYIVSKVLELPAGIVDSLVNLVLHLAGNPLKSDKDLNRLEAELGYIRLLTRKNIYDQLILLILWAFPGYKLEDIDEMDWNEIMRLSMMAEYLLLSRGSLKEPISLRADEEQGSQKSAYEQMMEDAKKMSKVDGGPSSNQMQEDFTPHQQKQMKTLEMIKQRRREG
jgi:hypothetical protein